MTIYHRLKVWAIKGYRLVTSGFMWIRPRTRNSIFILPVIKDCDYCDAHGSCVVLEADYEVYPVMCVDCIKKALRIAEKPITPSDRRGVVTH